MKTIQWDSPLKFLSFWAINDKLEACRLKKQLGELKKLGFDGVIFHPRNYPGQPLYLSAEYYKILSETILYAKELSMEFWLYDENGWPSGHADGQVMKQMGDCLCEWLVYENGQVRKKSIHEVNTFSAEACECFLKITYDGYRKGLQQEAFDYVTGFFSDEAGFLDGHGVSIRTGGVPWHEEIAIRYQKQYGDDLKKVWESLFLEVPGYETVRYRFWEIAAGILSENFYARINSWCEQYGKRYAAHLKGEENLFFQISSSGSAFRNLMAVNTPAVDALERYPGNHYYPRIASSISKQLGDGSCMAEAMGGSGWGMNPSDMEAYIGWLAGCGINTFAFHISQYRKDTASVSDWPPDIPFGLTWRKVFPALFKRMHQYWDKRVLRRCPVLLVAPARRVMAEFDPADAMQLNEHNGSGVPCSKSGRVSIRFNELVETLYQRGIDFDVAEEWMIEQYGEIREKMFCLGKQQYQYVILGEGCLWVEPELQSQLTAMEIGFEGGKFCWELADSGSNQMLLEESEMGIPFYGAGKVSIRSMDKLSELKVMGDVVEGQYIEEWYVYPIPEKLLEMAQKENKLHIRYVLNADKEKTMVFLYGDFLVESISEWKKDGEGGRQVTTLGPFRIVGKENGMYKEKTESCGDLIVGGYPFMGEPVVVKSLTYIGKDGICRIGDAEHIQAAAAEVAIDNTHAGYCWGPEWFVNGAEEGIHEISVSLIPSTYNTYGPHHYYLGDHYLISPAQYSGEKNFVDTREASACTKESKWHFVRFGIR